MYGPVPGETTEAGAMGWILRSLHKEFGDKPQVSKLFQVRGTQSVAALFTLTNRNHGNVPWTGMVIAVKTATDNVEGGAVYDDASRFPTSFNPMMKALFAAWHPFAAATAGAGKASALPPMQKFTARDNSASVDYPEGWKTVRQRWNAGHLRPQWRIRQPRRRFGWFGYPQSERPEYYADR